MFSALLVFLSIALHGISADVLCYNCYGNSSDMGRYCSIDSLCSGKACVFHHDGGSSWSAGCGDAQKASPSIQCQLVDGTKTTCTCSEDFCNQFSASTSALRSFWGSDPPFDQYDFYHPDFENNAILCMECGNVSVAGITKHIPCTEEALCMGQHCVTKRGQNPHSFCGTSWETKNVNVRCYKVPGEEEECICPEQLCNAVLPPELQEEATTKQPVPASQPTTVPAATTQAPTTTKTPGKKNCNNGMKFSPNAQAVSMGEKLKAIMNGQFGANNSNKLAEFDKSVDSHICNYSP